VERAQTADQLLQLVDAHLSVQLLLAMKASNINNFLKAHEFSLGQRGKVLVELEAQGYQHLKELSQMIYDGM